MMPHWLAHQWSKWEPFEVEVTRTYYDSPKEYKAVERRQRRRCEICGYQEEAVIQRGFRA